jgi:hypothetical protein
MKRVFLSYLWVIVSVVAVCAISPAQSQPDSQSLGDYARAVRKAKPATETTAKSYDNDNLPRTTKLSTVGPPSEPETDTKKEADAKGDKADAQKDGQRAPKDKEAQKSDDKKKALDAWKEKFDAQKQKIDLLSRELDVVQREYQIRAAAFYADAGNRLRNSGQWDVEDRKYKQQIDDKKKALEDAKSQLNDIEEQARKAGIPNSVSEN